MVRSRVFEDQCRRFSPTKIHKKNTTKKSPIQRRFPRIANCELRTANCELRTAMGENRKPRAEKKSDRMLLRLPLQHWCPDVVGRDSASGQSAVCGCMCGCSPHGGWAQQLEDELAMRTSCDGVMWRVYELQHPWASARVDLVWHVARPSETKPFCSPAVYVAVRRLTSQRLTNTTIAVGPGNFRREFTRRLLHRNSPNYHAIRPIVCCMEADLTAVVFSCCSV